MRMGDELKHRTDTDLGLETGQNLRRLLSLFFSTECASSFSPFLSGPCAADQQAVTDDLQTRAEVRQTPALDLLYTHFTMVSEQDTDKALKKVRIKT
jgi:hypothetical protein